MLPYYNEAIDDLTNVGIGREEYAEMRIVDTPVRSSSVGMCFGGLAVAIVFGVIFTLVIIKDIAKNKKEKGELVQQPIIIPDNTNSEQ